MTDLETHRSLRAAAERAARAHRLLVSTDFDGTLSEIVDDPDAAFADANAVSALRDLAGFPRTGVVVISGRGVADLRQRLPYPEIVVVGAHGAEFEHDFFPRDPAAPKALNDAAAMLGELTHKLPHSFIERKPMGIALHFRSEEGVEEALRTVRSFAAGHSVLVLREGKRVAELVPRGPNKADAFRAFRASADSAVFIGDDQTDEVVFAALGADDVGVKVGAEPSAAQYRVPDVQAGAGLLRFLVDARVALQKV